MGDLVPPQVLERKRAERVIAHYNDVIDHFTEYAREAANGASANEAAKLAYIDGLPEWLRRDLGYA